MDSEGQRGASNPSAMLAALLSKRDKLQEELRNIEKQVEEHIIGRDDGRSEYGPGRSKGGSTPANGQGKPKKGGRSAQREGKRIRPSTELELEDDDDLDLSLR